VLSSCSNCVNVQRWSFRLGSLALSWPQGSCNPFQDQRRQKDQEVDVALKLTSVCGPPVVDVLTKRQTLSLTFFRIFNTNHSFVINGNVHFGLINGLRWLLKSTLSSVQIQTRLYKALQESQPSYLSSGSPGIWARMICSGILRSQALHRMTQLRDNLYLTISDSRIARQDGYDRCFSALNDDSTIPSDHNGHYALFQFWLYTTWLDCSLFMLSHTSTAIFISITILSYNLIYYFFYVTRGRCELRGMEVLYW